MPISKSDTTSNRSLRIIGVYLRAMDSNIIKILKPGWYPFGNFDAPINKFISRDSDLSRKIQNIYNIHNQLPTVNISCIVGMNGSGKSTLVDIIYRILNNISYKLVEYKKTPISHNLKYAYGVNADLYYENDGKLKMFSCQEEHISFFKENSSGRMDEMPLYDSSFDDIMKNFFYTIGVNYSLYAFNKSDYKPAKKNEFIDGEWLDGIFHKNDGYLAPITLVPYRDNGIIDVQRENTLAKQRIIALSILGRAESKQFPDGYFPETITFNINPYYKAEKLDRFSKKYPQVPTHIINQFEFGWEKYLSETFPELNSYESDIYNLTLFYLAYKTIKICLTYNDYNISKDFSSITPDEINSIIKKISNKPENHITSKIFQCLFFIKTYKGALNGEINVQKFITSHNPETYDDVFNHLPPPFFETDILFKKVNNHSAPIGSNYNSVGGDQFKLSSMSSGEKQLLYVLSYILYHIRNIQSVDEDRYRIPYHHINLIFDEAELYFHPDLQRRFISMLLECFTWTKIDRRKIRSINIIIVTHSPFVLTDILTQNTLYLRNGIPEHVSQQTFGGNYYEMLHSNFFFEETAIGNVSTSAISEWITEANNRNKLDEDLIKLIGDPFIKNYVTELLKKDVQDS